MNTYDAIIIGSGLGGLLSGVFLAKEGLKVAIIEQNKQLGGCLQTFSFDKKIFDSCVHYIGAMDEGQNQNLIFKYAGILQDLKLKKLDINAFDKILFDDDITEYAQAQGQENFKEILSNYFPDEKNNLTSYFNDINLTCNSFPLYNLRNGNVNEKEAVMHWQLNQKLNEIFKSDKLKKIITGNSLLYAGNSNTPFYTHALVLNSYIKSAYKFETGSSQIAKALTNQLRIYGADIFKNERVITLKEKDGKIDSAVTHSGKQFFGKNFIVNAHPATALTWIDSKLLKHTYKKRIKEAVNSISSFMVNIVLQSKTVPFINSNYYWNNSKIIQDYTQYNMEDFPVNYALYFTEDPSYKGFADTVSILTYMHASETEQWQQTHNRTAAPSDRNEQYHEWKQKRCETLLQKVAERFPELKNNIVSYKIATPLTYRDYMGSPDGAMYGIEKNVHKTYETQIPIKTKIPNLLFTGQNVNLHGVLGVSVSAVATCGYLLGLDYLLSKINKA